MTTELRRWTPTVKLAILFLILFFLLTNLSTVWLLRKSQKELENELKVKLQRTSQTAFELLNQPRSSESQKNIYAYLKAYDLVALGVFDKTSRPSLWTNRQKTFPFWVELSPVTKPTFSGIKPFGGHFTLTYSFPPSAEQPGGFVVASADRLGQMENSLKLQIGFWVVGFLLTGLVVALLWKFIAAPFEVMGKTATEARFWEIPDGNDPASAMIEVFQNVIAELKTKEAELSLLYQQSEKKALHLSTLSQHLLESLNSGIVIFGADGKIADLNPAARSLLGLEENLRIPTEIETVLQQIGIDRPAEGVELEVNVAGKTKTLAVSASVISNAEKQNLGKALVISELTNFKELERKLEEREHWAFLGETAAGLAHELRNALAVMMGYTKLLTKALGNRPPLLKTAGQLLKEAQAAEETLKRFLDYARPANNLEREQVDLKELLEGAVTSLQTRFPNTVFLLGLRENIPYEGDPHLLYQIFSNLLCNGAEAAGKGGTVKVEAAFLPEERCWKISLADSGPGIPEEIKEKIFSPFFTTKPEGTGLGLALVKKAVHLLEGNIGFENRQTGAVFTLTLPIPKGLRFNPQENKVQKLHHVGGSE